jgi:hypothetical protein
MFKNILKRKDNTIYFVRPAFRCNLFCGTVMLSLSKDNDGKNASTGSA